MTSGKVDLVAFPENHLVADNRTGVVDAARRLAEDIAAPVLTGVWCEREQMQCAAFWNPRPARGDTESHFYAKHVTSVRCAYELRDYKRIRDAMFAPIVLRGRNIGVQLCHDMFFGLVSARLRSRGADVLIDLTGSNVNESKWRNVIRARSLEHPAPFLCTMSDRAGEQRRVARAFAYSAGRPLLMKTVGRGRTGSYAIVDVDHAAATGADDAEQLFTDKFYEDIRLALGRPEASADIHVSLDRSCSIPRHPRVRDWHVVELRAGTVGVRVLPIDELASALAIHRAEPPSPFDHHILTFVGARSRFAPAERIALAQLRAIEHRVAIAILTDDQRDVIKTNRYKNIQRFREHAGVFGLNTEFLGGTYAYCASTGIQGLRRDHIADYRALLD